MAELPNLAGVVSKGLVDTIGTGKYAAPYVNWSRTMQLLRENAPGWLVDYEPSTDGTILHRAPVGGYLMIRFRHLDGTLTPALPQAVMDNRNNAIAFDKITARDITDTHRRGLAMAAALQFGLASELWAGNMGENPYRPEPAKAPSGNGTTVPATQQETSSNGSAPTVASLKELMDKLPADDATALKQAFMADHFPSFEGGMAAKHLGKAEHRTALKQLIDEYKTPVAA